MKKLLLFLALAAAGLLFGVQNANAQTDSEYNAALDAIESGVSYYITTDVSGTKYYLTNDGALTSAQASAGVFTITKANGGEYKSTGFKIHGTTYFSNPPGENDAALTQDSKLHTDDRGRDTWEAQVLFLNSKGKYAVRSTNAAIGSSSWNYVGNAYWTVNIADVPVAQYSFDVNYIWNIEVTFTPKAGNNYNANTYANLFDGNTGTKWETAANETCTSYDFPEDKGNVVFEASSAIYVNGITLYTGNDTEGEWQRNPVEWILYGSNDEAAVIAASGETPDFLHSSWEVIAHIEDAQMPSLNETPKYFSFSPSQSSYKYFKFHVCKHVQRWTDKVQLSRLVLDYTLTTKVLITYIADGGDSYNNEGAANLFDGSSATKWCKTNNASTNWVVFQTSKPIYASSYTIQTANDSDGRDPKTFKLYGALDAAPTTDGSIDGWTEIDSESNASSTIPTDRNAFADFTIDSPGIYQFFMFKAEANRSNDASFQMAELIIDNDPVYEIITSNADMAEFASKVNSGSTSRNAFLMADVNSSISIGTTDYKFAGIFDGQGHIVNLNISNNQEFQGLIGYAAGGAEIKNVITRGSVSGSARCGGVLGGSKDATGTITLTNCGNEASVTVSGQNAAGIVGCNSGGSAVYNLINCYNAGTISGGSESAGIAGWLGSGASVTNCYNIGSVTGDEDGRTFTRSNSDGCTHSNCYSSLNVNHYSGEITTNYSMDKVTSGELCYKLNGDTNDGTTWTQTIGTDNHPIPFSTHLTVHQANTSSFTNLPVSGNVVQIDSADDLVKFSAEVNNGNISMNADVVADIDMTGKGGSWWPIGQTDADDTGNDGAKAYKGTFNGNGHTIDNLVQSSSNGNKNQGLFGVVNGGCIIENLIIGSGCKFYGSKFVGAFVGSSRGAGWVTIRNCGNEADVTSSGVNAAAYIGAVVDGGPATDIKNCYNKGNITGSSSNKQSAIIAGWFGNHGSVKVSNFYNIGSISGCEDNKPLFRNSKSLNTFSNVYHTSAEQGATKIEEGWEGNGTLCYKLNGSSQGGTNWYQTLAGTDAHPYPFNLSPSHRQVYSISATSYTNLPVADGKVQISNADDLNTFAAEVNNGNRSMNAELTDNIDYTEYTSQASMVGKDGKTYNGTFDGKFHTVTVAFNNTVADETGLFQRMDGGTIKNLKVDGTISTNKKLAAGICSGIWQTGTITNCWSDVTINDSGSGDATHGGIVAHVKDNTNVTITDCLFSGKINASNRTGSGALVGWADSENDNIKINHCLVVGEVNLKGSADNDIVCRRNATTANNYYTCDITNLTNNRSATVATSDQKTNGQLCCLLNNDGTNWYQTLGTDNYPVPFSSSEPVLAGQWFNSSENDVYYNEDASHNITVYQLNLDDSKTVYNVPANVTAKNVSINRTIPVGQWIGLCLPFDYDIPSGWDVRELTSVVGSGENASMRFSAASSIVAGKPYIVKPTASVTSITATDKAIATAASTVEEGDINMIGNFAQTAIATGSFYINTSSQLRKLTATSANLKGFRVYFTLDGGSGVKALSFDLDGDDATGINSPLLTSPEEEGQVYNLAGQRLSKAQRGINIINGKKILK